jgi:hypothetical protein
MAATAANPAPQSGKGMRMNRFGYTAVMTSGLAPAVIGFAGAAHADGPGNAQQTISQLQADGYTVIVNRLGATPLDQAAVVAVRPGQTFVSTDSRTVSESIRIIAAPVGHVRVE